MQRVHNFNPGPAALPFSVLEEIQETFLDFAGTGMSIVEVSHRSKAFEDVLNDAIIRTKRLLKLDDRFQVLFIQGGASLQFCMIPMNLLADGKSADYVNTGTWATKAIKEAKNLGKSVRVAASSEDRNFCYIPKNIAFDGQAAYVHITSNNTIKGTQWANFPNTGAVPLIADMSSDMLSRPFDPSPFGLIYAGAQKNIGPAGVCMAIIRKDMLERVPEKLPVMLKYTTFSKENSLFNTPPCFSIYATSLVLKWLEETIGGLDKMQAVNEKKAALIYNVIDGGDFYRGTADKDSRSLMNITFRLPDENLEKEFLAQAQKNALGGLKGHRSVGGCRASVYNAVPMDSCKALADFMKEFERKQG